MQFFNRLFGSDAKVSRVRPGDRSPRRRRAQFSLETLEGRDLKSGIEGVSCVGGVLTIQATQASNNVASVAIDSSNQMLKVTLNGNSEWYNPSDVGVVTYNGSTGGGDTFTNDTMMADTIIGHGGGNQFYGSSSGYNLVYMYGDYDTFDARGGYGFVGAYTLSGPTDNIPSSGGLYVYEVTFNPAWFGW